MLYSWANYTRGGKYIEDSSRPDLVSLFHWSSSWRDTVEKTIDVFQIVIQTDEDRGALHLQAYKG